ncbi:ectonucleotide pyrophosphatase/phosphodiesterase [Lysobacter hankyongensis]|uniref:Ectonucleotide pyrophosphatase/phosphodiesterase n=1 Tax=Lysobacter hankyongensis TaxID=1176535 RepID=A0ABP9B9D7_9GAMM
MMPRRLHTVFPAWIAVLVLSLPIAACTGGPTARPAPIDAGHRVVLVSIDGLPASMLGDGTLPTLDAIAAEGARAEWLNSSYPTLTFPNHYTLVTGLRPDHHGIVHNNMLDEQLGRFISKEDGAKDGRWWGGEPIWATLQKQGGIAATMFWPGSEARIAGERPRHARPFDKTVTASARVDQILQWLDLPVGERPQLLTLYFDQYDVTAHEYGATAPQSLAALRGVDAALAKLRDGLRARGMVAGTDLIVLSDHGMADVPRDHLRLLDDRLDASAYTLRAWGTLVGIVPKPGRDADVERAFLGRHDVYACWRKAELPKAWHYGTHARVPPIVCQVDAGWRVQTRANAPQSQPVKGEHGFAPEDPTMRAVFVASGPSFKRGVVLPAFDNVDIYPLLARLLRVQPAPNDGSLASTEAALR